MDLGNNNHQMATNITKRETSRQVPPRRVHNITCDVVLAEKKKLNVIKLQNKTNLQKIQRSDEYIY